MLHGDVATLGRGGRGWKDLASQLEAGLGVPVAVSWRHPLLGEGRVASPNAPHDLDPDAPGALQRCWTIDADGEVRVALGAAPPAERNWEAWAASVLSLQLTLAVALRRKEQLRQSQRLQQARTRSRTCPEACSTCRTCCARCIASSAS